MRTACAALVCFLLPALAHAQAPAPSMRRYDVTMSAGWMGAEYRHLETYDRWHGSLFNGLNLGRYWTDNLKTEVEAGWLSTVRTHAYGSVMVGSDRAQVESDYALQDLRLSISQSVQFGRNAWVHPFLGAGVDVDVLRTTEDRARQDGFIYGIGGPSRTVRVPALHEKATTVRAVPFVKAGFKLYVSDRTFVVQEFKFGITDRFDHALWKTGFGFDF